MVEEANVYFQNEDYEKAAELFERVITETINPLVTLNLGRCYIELKKFEKAIHHFSEAARLFHESS